MTSVDAAPPFKEFIGFHAVSPDRETLSFCTAAQAIAYAPAAPKRPGPIHPQMFNKKGRNNRSSLHNHRTLITLQLLPAVRERP